MNTITGAEEEWKPLPVDIDPKGSYLISNRGKIQNRLGKRLNGSIRCGYRVFGLFFSGRQKCYSAHRLVWITFIGRIPDGQVIHHKNGDKLDNRLKNLDCVTPSVNSIEHYKLKKSGNKKTRLYRPGKNGERMETGENFNL